jgi:hypothetical protein
MTHFVFSLLHRAMLIFQSTGYTAFEVGVKALALLGRGRAILAPVSDGPLHAYGPTTYFDPHIWAPGAVQGPHTRIQVSLYERTRCVQKHFDFIFDEIERMQMITMTIPIPFHDMTRVFYELMADLLKRSPAGIFIQADMMSHVWCIHDRFTLENQDDRKLPPFSAIQPAPLAIWIKRRVLKVLRAIMAAMTAFVLAASKASMLTALSIAIAPSILDRQMIEDARRGIFHSHDLVNLAHVPGLPAQVLCFMTHRDFGSLYVTAAHMAPMMLTTKLYRNLSCALEAEWLIGKSQTMVQRMMWRVEQAYM